MPSKEGTFLMDVIFLKFNFVQTDDTMIGSLTITEDMTGERYRIGRMLVVG